MVFSSLHPSGEKLKNISGIAAILRFDVPELEEEGQEMQEEPEQAVFDEEELANIDIAKLKIDEESDDMSGSEEEVEEEE